MKVFKQLYIVCRILKLSNKTQVVKMERLTDGTIT